MGTVPTVAEIYNMSENKALDLPSFEQACANLKLSNDKEVQQYKDIHDEIKMPELTEEELKKNFQNCPLLDETKRNLFQCIVCIQLVQNPVKCHRHMCEQVLCQECVEQIKVHEEKPHCPNCRYELQVEPIGRHL